MASGSFRRCCGDFGRGDIFLRFGSLRGKFEPSLFRAAGASAVPALFPAGVAHRLGCFFEEDLDGMEVFSPAEQAKERAVECVAVRGAESVAANCFPGTIRPTLLFPAQSFESGTRNH